MLPGPEGFGQQLLSKHSEMRKYCLSTPSSILWSSDSSSGGLVLEGRVGERVGRFASKDDSVSVMFE
jgi:hypothetical protein